MPIYARKHVLEQIKREFAYAFAEKKYPGVPMIATHTIDNAPFTVAGIEVTPIDVLHYKLPVFGFRIGHFTYITDANYISPEEKEKARGSKVLVLNALQKEKHISHYTLAEALEVIEELQPEQAYLIHMSHRMGRHKVIDDELPANVRLAYDGLKVSI